MANIQSRLKKSQLIERLNDDELHGYACKAYHIKNKALVDINEINDPYFRQEVINYADKKYGKRK